MRFNLVCQHQFEAVADRFVVSSVGFCSSHALHLLFVAQAEGEWVTNNLFPTTLLTVNRANPATTTLDVSMHRSCSCLSPPFPLFIARIQRALFLLCPNYVVPCLSS